MSGVFGNPWLYNHNIPFYPYEINQSLRFDIARSTNLTRTAGSPSDGKKATWSWWMKKSDITADTSISYKSIFYAGSPNSNGFRIGFKRYGGGSYHTHDLLINQDNGSSAAHMFVYTNAVYKDVSSFYHFVVSYDSTDSTAADRIKIYVNGTQQTINTTGAWANAFYPPLNHIPSFQVSGQTLRIGEGRTDVNEHIGGYLAEVVFIDGTAYDASNFGETIQGVWVPKDSSGLTFGNNGFYLPFDDPSAIGDDESSNTNDFTANNFSAHDVVLDSPTNNFATLNSLDNYNTGATLSEGNLKWTIGGADGASRSTFVMTAGKWYVEFLSNNDYIGVVSGNASIVDMNGTQTIYYAQDGTKRVNGSGSSYGSSYANGDIIGIALDLDASPQTVTFYKNNASQGSLNLTDVGNEGYSVSCGSGSGSTNATANFGQDSSFANAKTSGSAGASDSNGVGDFYYAVPSGFLALASASLPEPSIIDGTKHFNTVLYTGNQATRSIAVPFQTDFLWIKGRSTDQHHNLYDALRADSDGPRRLYSSLNITEESTVYNGTTNVSSFDANGFTMGDGTSVNENSKTFVAWNWLVGGDAPTKTYKVHVVSDSGNKYRFRNSADTTTYDASAVTLDLQEGGTYTFDLSNSSVNGHPMKFSTTSNGSHGGGTTYSTGVVYKLDDAVVSETDYVSNFNSATSRTVAITVAASAPTLYYFCHYHSGMGGQVNTNSTFGSTNFDGTLIATVSANVEAGFSIATWAGNAVDNTIIPHGLGGTIDCVITKSRTIVTSSWLFLHSAIASDTNNILQLNSTAGATNGSSTLDSCPDELTSVGFKLVRGTTSGMNSTNGSGRTYVGYCFKNVEGFQKCGEYIGLGGTDGAYVHLGFRPVFVLLKENTVRNWVISYDDETYYNGLTHSLFPNIIQTEDAYSGTESGGGGRLDFLSNGFKLRTTSTSWNDTDGSFIYIAFADQPQKFSNAR